MNFEFDLGLLIESIGEAIIFVLLFSLTAMFAATICFALYLFACGQPIIFTVCVLFFLGSTYFIYRDKASLISKD